VAESVCDSCEEAVLCPDDSRIVAAHGLTRIRLAHNRDLADRIGGVLKFPGDDEHALREAVVEFDFIGEAAYAGQPRSQAAIGSRWPVTDYGAGFVDARTQIRGNDLKAFNTVSIDRSD
jgi:hypothetical protein